MAITIDKIKKQKNVIVTIFQTIIVVGIALVITIVSCNFKFKEFNWLTFLFNFIFTTVMKASYTNYSKEKELLNEEITLLTATIANDRRIIFNQQKTDDFEKEIDRRNKISKLDAYISKLDYLIPKKKKHKKDLITKRNWAFEYKKALEKNQETEEFEKTISIKSIKIDYEHIEASKLFTYGANAKTRKKKYVFSSWNSSLNRALIPVTVSMFMSIIFGAIKAEGGLNSGQVWIDFSFYMFSVILGIWWGYNNGKAIIKEDYTEVLNNVASLIRDVKNKIGISEKEEN